ncbi:MAG: uroporphyrinogen-III synthase [Pseudomonadota bacterium]|nr:uroporphyrinogen-III synthase [Pseudomonadota bacterium]
MNGPRLEGLGVVITRPREPAEVLAAALAREGARPIVFPALAIEDLPPSPQLDAALGQLPRAAFAIFVSAHAVERGLAAVHARRTWPESVRVAAVGEATADALRNSGFDRVISPPERHDSEALLALPELQAVRDLNIIIFRGAGGRERLREVLGERGAHVAYAECYRRVRPDSDPRALLEAWSRGQVQVVSALSGETLENFVAMVGEAGARHMAAATLVVPHAAVAAHREARRFARVLIAPHGAEGFANTLSQLRVPT